MTPSTPRHATYLAVASDELLLGNWGFQPITQHPPDLMSDASIAERSAAYWQARGFPGVRVVDVELRRKERAT